MHGLLSDAVISHQKTVRMNNERADEVRGRQEQDGHNGRPDDRRPRDGQEAGEFPSGEREGSEGHDVKAQVEFALQARTLLRHVPLGTISHQSERHSVEMVESVVEWMVTVIVGGLTVETQMPFS